MTLADVTARVDALRKHTDPDRWEDPTSHIDTDQLYIDVLKHIAKSDGPHGDLARAALEIESWDLTKWYE